MLEDKEDMQGLMACSYCHDQEFIAYMTSGELKKFNELLANDQQPNRRLVVEDGDTFCATKIWVVAKNDPRRQHGVPDKVEYENVEGEDPYE